MNAMIPQEELKKVAKLFVNKPFFDASGREIGTVTDCYVEEGRVVAVVRLDAEKNNGHMTMRVL